MLSGPGTNWGAPKPPMQESQDVLPESMWEGGMAPGEHHVPIKIRDSGTHMNRELFGNT